MLPDFGAYARIAGGFVKLIHQPCTPERAKRLIQGRMARREQLFLQMVREGIWQHPDSPYRRLLVWAGWSFDTVAESVHRRGLEATLEALRDSGVYLSQEEKGATKPIQRDGLVIDSPTEHVFYNPRVVPVFEVRTGATRSRGTAVPATLDYIADQRAVAWCLSLEALGTQGWPVVVWMTRGAGFLWWLSLAHMGRPPLRWFSTTDLSMARIPHMHEAMVRLMQGISLTRGMRMPYLESVPLSSPDVVLEAVLKARRVHGGCAVVTTPSAATRLAGMAESRGVDLEHVAFLVGGEPLTPGKHAEISRTGARVGARYNLTEAGAVGGTCSHPADPDDVHLLTDSFALIPHKRVLPDGSSVDAFVLTALLPSSPGISLNVETDDFGQITVRRCGCLWDELGMHTHLSNIRSFSKLTGEGVTVLGTDCVRTIEEILPREFGGHSTDYQLLEVEDADHLTRLHLVVRPAVGLIDEERLLARFIDAAGLRRMDRWQQAGTIKVIRQEPVPTAAGKLLPFHTLAFTLPSKEPSEDQKVRVGRGQ
jgi:hypothetical protein